MSPSADLARRLRELRRELHRAPELGLACRSAAKLIRRELRALGLAPRDGGAESGVLCDLDFAGGKKVRRAPRGTPRVLLRADTDGLPLQETGAAAKKGGYASRHPGVMHACGHDGHVAMLLGAAALLLENPPEQGSVRLMFQPGEEGPGGAEPMIRAGALEGVDRAFGLHLWNRLNTGSLGILPGPAMAACDEFRITVKGEGGHGAHPAETADTVLCAAHTVTRLQTIVAREIPPGEPAVVSVCAIRGGEAFNVIPAEVQLRGTLRSFRPAVRDRLERRVREIARGVAATAGLRAEVEINRGYPPLVNGETLSAQAMEWAKTVAGVREILTPPAEMGAEDFACIAERVPSVFVFVGARGGAARRAGPHHSPTFDLDEAALPIGARLLHRLAVKGLAA